MFNIAHRISANDAIVELPTCPQARKKCPHLPEKIIARLVKKNINDKKYEVLTSMIDIKKYSRAEIVDLYTQRWEIELGFREMKQFMLQNRLTLRSKKPDMIRQELWGVLLASITCFAAEINSSSPEAVNLNLWDISVTQDLKTYKAIFLRPNKPKYTTREWYRSYDREGWVTTQHNSGIIYIEKGRIDFNKDFSLILEPKHNIKKNNLVFSWTTAQ